MLSLIISLAAHCLKQTTVLDSNKIKVVLGAHDVHRIEDNITVIATVCRISLHHDWNPDTDDFKGDLAVIKLCGKVTWNRYIRPVCLPTKGVSNVTAGVVYGWGQYDNTTRSSNLPRKVDIEIVPAMECLTTDRALVYAAWTESFCAGKKGVGVCAGDSGSGFYVEQNGIVYLRGIVSAAIDRGCINSYLTLYADVEKYLEFIADSMELEVSVIT